MRVILNKCYGGFGISTEGYRLYAKKVGVPLFVYKNDYSNNTLVRVDGETDDNSLDYFTVDLGESISRSDIPSDVRSNNYLYLNSEYRDNPILVEVVEELGEKANGRFASLTVVDIPDDMSYEVTDYDGIETLHELHRQW